MRFRLLGIFAGAVAAIAGVAQAAPVLGQGTWGTTLEARDLDGDGVTDAFYDTDLHLTWLRDANLNGAMNWSAANTWANNLVVGGYGGWRLPNALDADGRWCGGYRCTASEMGHLWLTELGNLDETVFNGNSASVNTGYFRNLEGYFWTGAGTAFWQTYFLTNTGYQYEGQNNLELRAMAVRNGDAVGAVPEPQTLALALIALCGLAVARRHGRD